MDKDAITSTKSKIPTSDGTSNGSSIFFILAIISLIAIGLYFFKDKIFKKSTKLNDTQKDDTQKDVPVKPETLEEPELTEINDKFAEMSK